MPLAPFGIVTFNDLDAAIDLAAKKPACLARQLTTPQSLVSGTNTTMTFNSVEFDNDVIAEGASGTILSASRAGLWELNAVIAYAANATGVRELVVLIGGVVPGFGAPSKSILAISGVETYVEIHRRFELTVGQQLQIRGRQTSGGALNAFLSEFSLDLITDA